MALDLYKATSFGNHARSSELNEGLRDFVIYVDGKKLDSITNGDTETFAVLADTRLKPR